MAPAIRSGITARAEIASRVTRKPGQTKSAPRTTAISGILPSAAHPSRRRCHLCNRNRCVRPSSPIPVDTLPSPPRDPSAPSSSFAFAIATFRQIAERFPEHVLDVEIKVPRDENGQDDLDFAIEAAGVLGVEAEEGVDDGAAVFLVAGEARRDQGAAAARRLEQVLRFELDEVLPFDIEDTVFDFVELERLVLQGPAGADAVPPRKKPGSPWVWDHSERHLKILLWLTPITCARLRPIFFCLRISEQSNSITVTE